MKSVFTTIILAGIIFLSSCSNKDDSTTNLLVIPSADSVSKNSSVKIFLSGTDSFYIHDLTVKNLPIEYLFASDTYSPNDSIWTTRILLTDYTSKQISLNLTANNTSTNPLGYFYVTNNSSTLTNFTNGENKTYAILPGSYVNVTQSSYPITGTLSLTLFYNQDTIYSYGNFEIYY